LLRDQNTLPGSEYRTIINELIVMQLYCEMHSNNISQPPPKKTLKRNFYCRPWGTVLIESTQIRWFLEKSGVRLDLERDSKRHSKLS
jgi:hypothetical protein